MLIVTTALVVSLTFWGKAVGDRDDLRVANKQVEQAREAADTQAAVARAESQRAQEAEQKAVALSANLALDRGQMLAEAGNVGHGMLWMARTLQFAPTDAADLRRVTRVNLAAWYRELHALRATLPHPRTVRAVAFSPDGRSIFTASSDGTARLWDVAT